MCLFYNWMCFKDVCRFYHNRFLDFYEDTRIFGFILTFHLFGSLRAAKDN